MRVYNLKINEFEHQASILFFFSPPDNYSYRKVGEHECTESLSTDKTTKKGS